MPAAFEIAPGPRTDAVLELLHARGYRHTGFHCAFAGWSAAPAAPGVEAGGVEVRRVETDADLTDFSDAYHRGWDTAPSFASRPGRGWRRPAGRSTSASGGPCP